MLLVQDPEAWVESRRQLPLINRAVSTIAVTLHASCGDRAGLGRHILELGEGCICGQCCDFLATLPLKSDAYELAFHDGRVLYDVVFEGACTRVFRTIRSHIRSHAHISIRHINRCANVTPHRHSRDAHATSVVGVCVGDEQHAAVWMEYFSSCVLNIFRVDVLPQ